MHEFLINIAGWIPAIIFPLGTITQLHKIIKSKNTKGVSVSSWFCFGLANISLYLYTEKYFSIQSLLGLLLTALLDFVIVLLCLRYRHHHSVNLSGNHE